MLLSWQGGPTYCHNFVKSPVILNEAENDFILTPIYDALRQFAKLYPAGSRIIRCEYVSGDIAAAARQVGKSYDIIVANLTDKTQETTIYLGDKQKTLKLPASAIKAVKF
jgi:hypothetical protein